MHKNIENHAILLYCKNETPFTQIKMGSAMCAAPTRTSNKTHATWATSRTSNPKPDSPSGAKTVATNVAENVLPEATAKVNDRRAVGIHHVLHRVCKLGVDVGVVSHGSWSVWIQAESTCWSKALKLCSVRAVLVASC